MAILCDALGRMDEAFARLVRRMNLAPPRRYILKMTKVNALSKDVPLEL
jgi:hypothetical protein